MEKSFYHDRYRKKSNEHKRRIRDRYMDREKNRDRDSDSDRDINRERNRDRDKDKNKDSDRSRERSIAPNYTELYTVPIPYQSVFISYDVSKICTKGESERLVFLLNFILNFISFHLEMFYYCKN